MCMCVCVGGGGGGGGGGVRTSEAGWWIAPAVLCKGVRTLRGYGCGKYCMCGVEVYVVCRPGASSFKVVRPKPYQPYWPWCGRGGDFREYANTGVASLHWVGQVFLATPMELTLVR